MRSGRLVAANTNTSFVAAAAAAAAGDVTPSISANRALTMRSMTPPLSPGDGQDSRAWKEDNNTKKILNSYIFICSRLMIITNYIAYSTNKLLGITNFFLRYEKAINTLNIH